MNTTISNKFLNAYDVSLQIDDCKLYNIYQMQQSSILYCGDSNQYKMSLMMKTHSQPKN